MNHEDDPKLTAAGFEVKEDIERFKVCAIDDGMMCTTCYRATQASLTETELARLIAEYRPAALKAAYLEYHDAT